MAFLTRAVAFGVHQWFQVDSFSVYFWASFQRYRFVTANLCFYPYEKSNTEGLDLQRPHRWLNLTLLYGGKARCTVVLHGSIWTYENVLTSLPGWFCLSLFSFLILKALLTYSDYRHRPRRTFTHSGPPKKCLNSLTTRVGCVRLTLFWNRNTYNHDKKFHRRGFRSCGVQNYSVKVCWNIFPNYLKRKF